MSYSCHSNATRVLNVPGTGRLAVGVFRRSTIGTSKMARLTFRCPYTNKPFDSGIEVDPQSAIRVQAYPIRVRCPHCGIDHHGTIADGRLVKESDTAA